MSFHENVYYDNAFLNLFVVLCSNDSILGHLNRNVAKAVAETEGFIDQHGAMKLLG